MDSGLLHLHCANANSSRSTTTLGRVEERHPQQQQGESTQIFCRKQPGLEICAARSQHTCRRVESNCVCGTTADQNRIRDRDASACSGPTNYSNRVAAAATSTSCSETTCKCYDAKSSVRSTNSTNVLGETRFESSDSACGDGTAAKQQCGQLHMATSKHDTATSTSTNNTGGGDNADGGHASQVQLTST